MTWSTTNMDRSLLWLVGVIVLCKGQICPSYSCDKMKGIAPGTCGYYNEVENEWYMQQCSDGYVCAQLTPAVSTSNYTCQPYSPPLPSLPYPGEPCTYNADCFLFQDFGLGCAEDVCQGKQPGALCSRAYECQPGFTCIAAQCTAQKEAGQACSSDLDCVNTSGCDFEYSGQQGNCVPYLSLQPGESLRSCPGFQLNSIVPVPNVSYLCESGSCVSGPDMCVEALESKQSLPVNCTADASVCAAGNAPTGMQIMGTCEGCGYSEQGSIFCSLFPGDSYFSKLLSLTSSWLSSSALKSCNSARRLTCMSTMWSQSSYEQWQYYYFATEYYGALVDAQKCVIEVLFPEYSEAKKEACAVAVEVALISILGF